MVEQLTQFVIHHWALWLALFVLLGLLLRLELSSQVGGVTLSSTHEVTNLLNRDEGVVIDIRDEDAYKKGHITGAMSLPVAELEKKLKRLQKYKDKPIIISCASGQHFSKAGAILRKHGFEKIYALKGGINAWQKASLPLVK